MLHHTGCPRKTNFHNATGPTVHLAQSPISDALCVWKSFFGHLELRLGRIKPSQVMCMVKFGPTVLNFGYDFFLLVPFFGTPCIYKQLSILIDDSVTWRSKLPDFCVFLVRVFFSNSAESTTKLRVYSKQLPKQQPFKKLTLSCDQTFLICRQTEMVSPSARVTSTKSH